MTKTDGPKTRSRKLWDRHGSWLILIFVVGVAFNGGMEWQSYKAQKVVEAVVTSGRIERDELRARLRVMVERNQELAAQLGPAVGKAEQAVDKADEVVRKADQIIEANK
jgi:hypothetical protein